MAEKPTITLELAIHRGNDVVTIRFDDFNALVNPVRNFKNRHWSATMKCWYVFLSEFDKQLFNQTFAPIANIVRIPPEQKPPKEHKPLKKKVVKISPDDFTAPLMTKFFNHLEIKRYSDSTKKMYCLYFKEFILHFKKHKIDELNKDEINDYIIKLIRYKKISPSQQNQRINAIKFYYEKVLGRTQEYYNIERPRKVHTLPNVLSENEVFSILKATKNIKHKAILATIYSAGLRRGELINLRLQDVSFDNMMLFVRAGKGKKDRTTLLSNSNAIVLKKYMEIYKPNYWLFEGGYRKAYSASSIGSIIKKSAHKAGINKRVTPHMLRHSFATHLLEHGVDIRYIQTFLGHESTKTTEIYTHVCNRFLANIKSPLDQILEDK